VTSSCRPPGSRSAEARGEVAAVARRSTAPPRTRAAVLAFPRRRGRSGRLLVARLAPSGRSVLVGLLLAAVGLGAYGVARESSLFAVRAIEVHGAPPALAGQVRAALADAEGESLVALDRAAATRAVEAIPYVLEARLDRAFPHTLAVSVTLEQPAAVLRRGAESWLVSSRGRVLRRLPPGARPGLPRVWVPKTVAASPGVVVAAPQALRALDALRAVAADPLPVRVRTATAGEGELRFVLGSGMELRLGDELDLRLKLAVARRILPALAPRALGGPAYLDVSVPERPVAGTDPQVEGTA
jgi:cell division protein FtsQ